MSAQSLKLICEGDVEIIKITEDFYEDAVELFLNYFMKYETVSIACNLNENPDTVKEMQLFIKTALMDNISFAARDVKTQELVAICVNKIVNPSAQISLDEVFATFTTPNMQKVAEYLNTLESTYDIFQEWEIDCVFELLFITTRTDYAKRGIAFSLAKFALEYAAKLKENASEEAQQLPKHLRGQNPKALISVATSRYTQIVAEKLGLETLFSVENSKFSFEGKTFAEKIDPIHKCSTFVAFRL